jgi:general secretion pathway protein K
MDKPLQTNNKARLPLRQRLRNLLTDAKKPVKNNKGVALLIAISCVMMIMYFAMEVTYDSQVEYIVNSQGLSRLKAYYAAKSGVQISLLRIKIYQQAQNKFASMLGSNATMLNQIWQFPFAWPFPVPAEVNAVDKDSFKKITKESWMDASYLVTIEDEGSKIDINDLNSPSKTLADLTRTQLLNIFAQKIKEDEEFGRQYASYRFDELINNIADWMSAKSVSLNGGDKRSRYADMNKDSMSDAFPPNRDFRTLAELHMIPGMTDELFDILAPRITIYGMKGINPNIASKEVLKSLDPGMTEEVVKEVMARRDSQDKGGPFKDANDFWTFVQQKGARLEGKTDAVPLIFDATFNFRIRSTGEFAGATREITAIVMDLDKSAAKIKGYMDKDQTQANGQQPGQQNPAGAQQQTPGALNGPSGGNNAASALPKGPPRVVYWNER